MDSAGRRFTSSRADAGVYRSVLDYNTEDELRTAMMIPQGGTMTLTEEMAAMIDGIAGGQPVQKVTKTTEDQAELSSLLEWVLPYHDPDLTEAECAEQELMRLQNVKSYSLLDERDDAFDRITDLATRIFDVPISVISMLDLGRQWHVAYSGIDAPQLHRKDTMCAQTVMAKAKCVVVPDLTKDARFCNNVTVLNPPYSRFYASVPLMSPEGFKLGTLCIIDTVVRPHGLSTDHVKILCDLADTTVKVMVDRRALLKQQLLNNDPMHILSSAAHDMLTPLDGIRLSLSNLKDDDRVRSALDELQFEKLTAAARSSDLVIRMCRNALRTAGVPNLLEPSCAVITTTRLDVLVKNLRMVMDPMPKKVPIIISLDQGTPNEIVANESQLFRAALNILASALRRTESGTVHLTIKSNDGSSLMFECEDTGADIPVEESMNLFQPITASDAAPPSHTGLSSIPALIASFDGEYGYRPRGMHSDGTTVLMDVNGSRRSGSVFWFAIPLLAVGSSIAAPIQLDDGDGDNPGPSHRTIPAGSLDIDQGAVRENGMCGTFFSNATSSTTSYVISSTDNAVADRLGSPTLQPPADSSNPGRRPKILIIDDSRLDRKTLADLAQNLGYETTLAKCGMDGLKELQASLFDIVFCELSMPEIDGLECVAKYREWEDVSRPWDRQFIVGLSEHAHLNDRGQALQAGMDMFYPKPMTTKTLSVIQADFDVMARTEMLNQLVTSRKRRASLELNPEPERKSLHATMGNSSAVLVPASDRAPSAPQLHSQQLLWATLGKSGPSSVRHHSA